MMMRDQDVCEFLRLSAPTLRRYLQRSKRQGIQPPCVGKGKGRRWVPESGAWFQWYGEVSCQHGLKKEATEASQFAINSAGLKDVSSARVSLPRENSQRKSAQRIAAASIGDPDLVIH